MSRAARRILAAVAVAAVFPAVAAAQNGAQPETLGTQEMQALFQELQQIHVRLETIQNQALVQDPALNAERDQIGVDVQQAMVALDPQMHSRIARAEALESEAIAASNAGNMQRLEQLALEAEDIQEHMLGLQQRVLQTPEMEARLTAFQERLERKMTEVDPTTPTLIARFSQLQQILFAAQPDA